VLADRYEQDGDVERAELVRLDCELQRLDAWDRRAVAARWRLDALVARCGARVRATLPAIDGVEWTELQGGAACGVAVRDLHTLYLHAGKIAAAAPIDAVELRGLVESEPCPAAELRWWLRRLRIRVAGPVGPHAASSLLDVPDELIVVFDPDEASGALDWLQHRRRPLARLTVHCEIFDAAFAKGLAKVAWARTLERLELLDAGRAWDKPQLGEHGARAVAGLTGLRILAIDSQHVGDAGLTALVTGLPALRELSAKDCGVTDAACFVTASGAPLARLDLGHNRLGDDGVRALVSAPRSAAVEHLSLASCAIGAPGVRAIVEAPSWRTLAHLDLGWNPLGADGAAELARATAPAALHTLHLEYADLDPSSLAAIEWLDDLIAIDLSFNPLDAQVMRRLARTRLRSLVVSSATTDSAIAELAPLVPRLARLDVSHNPLGAGALARMLDGGGELESLCVRGCQLADDDVRAIARIPSLRRLDLGHNPRVGVGAIMALIDSPPMANLEDLDIGTCNLPDAFVDALIASPRAGRLRTLNLRTPSGVRPGSTLTPSFSEAALVKLAMADSLRGVDITVTFDRRAVSTSALDLLLARFGRHHNGGDPPPLFW
jgi:hypothetical protein